jgi:hypothetical protein
LSIRGSEVAKTPITGTLGVAFLMFGKCLAWTFFAISNTPFWLVIGNYSYAKLRLGIYYLRKSGF